MRPPPAHDAAIPAGWGGARARPGRARAARVGRWVRSRPLAAAAAFLAVVLAGAASAYEGLTPSQPQTNAGGIASRAGTASLASATCADWRREGVGARLATSRMLAVAATAPDPENPGATLAPGQAYALFQRFCSTPESRSALLYAAYNRAASFQSTEPGPAGLPGKNAQP
jgi:hypothetical protein